jgi:two-component system CheB/CheR fusion protein
VNGEHAIVVDGRSIRLLRVTRDLSFCRDLATLTATVGKAARELTGADGVTFVFREGDMCYYADEDAIAPLWKGARYPMSACISGWVMQHGEPAVVPNIYADSRIGLRAYRHTFVKSLAMVPVRPPEAIAAIGAYWASHHEPTADEISTLEMLADAAALALANVDLYGELRRSLDRERAARLKAEEANTAKNEALSIIAHELRQPLNAISAALGVMRARPDRDTGEQARAIVERQATQLDRIVDDLLDAARVVRGQVTLHRSVVDLREIFRHSIDAVRAMTAAGEQRFTIRVPDEPVVVNADGGRLQQVFVNVLSNAVKFSPADRDITAALARENDRAVVRVRDSGCGIDPSDLSRIFDLFERRTDWNEPGFGIGLAVAKGLVEQHGGTIAALSAGRGHGTEIVVTLPVAG